VFPLTSLGGLICLVLSPRLPAAVVVHLNVEAASNALFLPIANANYAPLPLSLQGRARTLSEGVFYPAGLALAGVVLWTADPAAAMLQVQFAALIFAGLFVLLGAGVGLLFVPTLRANVGAGLIAPGEALSSETAALPVPRVSALLRSREPDLRLLGIALARRVDPEALEDALRALATRSDRATRTALARFVADSPGPWAQNFLDGCMTGQTEEELKLALLVMLIRRAPLKPEHMRHVLGARDPAAIVLGRVVAEGPGAWSHIQPLVRRPGVASELVEAIVGAGRTDYASLLLACLETAEPEQQRRALAMLNASAQPLAPCETTTDPVRVLAKGGTAAVRAEAIVLRSRASPRSAAVRQLVAALDDSSPRVRRHAAQALCQHGDRAAAMLRRRLRIETTASLDVVWALAWIGSPRARRLLAACVRDLQHDAERTAWLCDWIAASPDRARWTPIELCLHDHHTRMVDVVLTALSPAIEARLLGRLRHALQGADQRYRASAFELVAAGAASRLIPGAVALLRYLLFEHGAGAAWLAGAGSERLLDQAMASMSPWVRRAAALVAAGPPALRPTPGDGSANRNSDGDRAMGLDDQEFERVVALKRTPLFHTSRWRL
jgi:HEAT repeat protein